MSKRISNKKGGGGHRARRKRSRYTGKTLRIRALRRVVRSEPETGGRERGRPEIKSVSPLGFKLRKLGQRIARKWKEFRGGDR